MKVFAWVVVGENDGHSQQVDDCITAYKVTKRLLVHVTRISCFRVT